MSSAGSNASDAPTFKALEGTDRSSTETVQDQILVAGRILLVIVCGSLPALPASGLNYIFDPYRCTSFFAHICNPNFTRLMGPASTAKSGGWKSVARFPSPSEIKVDGTTPPSAELRKEDRTCLPLYDHASLLLLHSLCKGLRTSAFPRNLGGEILSQTQSDWNFAPCLPVSLVKQRETRPASAATKLPLTIFPVAFGSEWCMPSLWWTNPTSHRWWNTHYLTTKSDHQSSEQASTEDLKSLQYTKWEFY